MIANIIVIVVRCAVWKQGRNGDIAHYTKFGILFQILIFNYQMWNFVTKYGILLPNMEFCYQIWNFVSKYGILLTNMEFFSAL